GGDGAAALAGPAGRPGQEAPAGTARQALHPRPGADHVAAAAHVLGGGPEPQGDLRGAHRVPDARPAGGPPASRLAPGPHGPGAPRGTQDPLRRRRRRPAADGRLQAVEEAPRRRQATSQAAAAAARPAEAMKLTAWAEDFREGAAFLPRAG